MKIKWAPLLTFILICELAGAFGSFFTRETLSSWYVYLNKPSFMPPSWVFAPVWTLLYFIMGIAGYLVWSKGWSDQKVKGCLILFFLQLLVNASWSFLFFGLCSPLYGLWGICVLWGLVLLTTLNFYSVSKAATYLFIPYIVWVTFATVLNQQILALNP